MERKPRKWLWLVAASGVSFTDGWLVNVDDMVWGLVVLSSMSYEQNIRFCDIQGCSD